MEAVRSVKQVDLSKTVLSQPLSSNAFVTHLNAAREIIIPDRIGARIKYNDLSAAIRQFESFLTEKRLEPVMPDEGLIDGFLQTLLKQKGEQYHKHCLTVTNNVRRLINHFPNDILRRQLLNTKTFKRANRFYMLEPKTQAILNEFIIDGRITKGGIFSIKRLSPNSRQKISTLAMYFLTIIEKKSLVTVDKNDVDTFIEYYDDEGNQRQLALNYLADLRSLFANMVGRKYIPTNPLEEYRRKTNKDDTDFIMPKPMSKIQDLSTLNFKDKWAVRNRMIVFALFYDFCLRCNEASLSKVSDILIENDMVAINLRGEIQKGQGKKDVMLYSFFPTESIRLIKAYLKIRKEMNPTTEAFLINQDGNPLMEWGCREAVRTCCEGLNVKTHKREKPYPHCYRHTFASINIISLGLRLDPYEIMRRLRHTDLSTTMRVYVNQNPLLLKEQHMATLNRNRQPGQNPMATFGKQANFQTAVNPNDISLPESDAILAVKPLGINWMSLRDYATHKQVAIHHERHYYYSRSFMQDLTQNYITKQQVMKQFKLAKGSFFFWKKSKGIEPLVIGHVSLVRKDDLFSR